MPRVRICFSSSFSVAAAVVGVLEAVGNIAAASAVAVRCICCSAAVAAGGDTEVGAAVAVEDIATDDCGRYRYRF